MNHQKLRRHLKLAATLLLLAGASQPDLRAQSILYGLTGTNSLVILNGDASRSFAGRGLTGLGAGETAVAIDFRPFNGELYAVTRDAGNEGRLYRVNPASGAATAVPLTAVSPPFLITGSVDIDFNPAALGGTNALRVVTSDRQNYRLVFTATGATVNTDGALNVAGGGTAEVIATAYGNNRGGLPGGAGAGGTVQYAIDSGADLFYRVNPPNNGTLINGLPLGLDIEAGGALDLVTGTDRALALLRVGGANGLYDINLTTGAASLINPLPPQLVSLAVPVPPATPTPLVHGLTASNTLVRFSADGGPVVAGPVLTGLGAGETMAGIDFRPATGDLYGVTRDPAGLGRIYVVDATTGAATPVPLSGPALNLAGSVGIDFNPTAAAGSNALRIVTSAGRNYRLLFAGGSATVNVDAALNVSGGAPGTNIIATAYSNNRAGLPGGGGAGSTTQYAIDSATDRIYRVNPPNNGTLVAGLALGVDIDDEGGLDIVTGTDRALGLFRVEDVSAVFQIDLPTGAAMPVRFLPDGIVDLAVPMPPVVPGMVVVGLSATNTLLTFNTDGGPVASGPVLTGLGAGEVAVGIDFRPFNGSLYAVTRDAANTGRLYVIDPATGAATPVPLAGAGLTLTGTVGMDFNPAALNGTNALRIVTGSEQNYRLVFTPAGATVNVDGALNASGAPATNITATAYSNNRAGLPGGGGLGGTVQYALDSDLDVLYRVNPPNNGVLIDAKPLGLDIRSAAGLDITTVDNRALAVLDVGGFPGLYDLNLANGATAFIRPLPAGVMDLAVPTPVRARMASAAGNLEVSGGVGPFGLLRADRVTDPFCGVAALNQRSIPVSRDGPSGFYRLVDLAATPAVRLTVSLSGAAERPVPVDTAADGFGTLELSGNTLSFNIGYRGLSGPATLAHIHGPATSSTAAGVLVDLAPFNGGAFGTAGTLSGSIALTADLKAAILSGRTYVNIHTTAHGGGELRGQIAPVVHSVSLSGAAQRPATVATDGGGFGLFTLVGRELVFDISHRDLSGPAMMAHLHGPAPASGNGGVLIDLMPFSVGPAGTAGRFAGRVTLTAAQLAAVTDGQTYVNIHTARHPAGEVRGQVCGVFAGTPLATELTGAAQRPTPVATPGSGFASLMLQGDTLSFQISYRGLSGPIDAAHFHAPSTASATAGVQVDLMPFLHGTPAAGGMFVGSIPLAPEHKAALLSGDIYINLHTPAFPNGEVRGQINPVVLQSVLTGGAQRPAPVTTPASGQGFVTALGRQLSLGVRYGGLTGPATMAHIHGPATAEGFAGILVDLAPFTAGGYGTSGFFLGSLLLSDANVASLVDGLTYINIHTDLHGGGELRGQLRP